MSALSPSCFLVSAFESPLNFMLKLVMEEMSCIFFDYLLDTTMHWKTKCLYCVLYCEKWICRIRKQPIKSIVRMLSQSNSWLALSQNLTEHCHKALWNHNSQSVSRNCWTTSVANHLLWVFVSVLTSFLISFCGAAACWNNPRDSQYSIRAVWVVADQF